MMTSFFSLLKEEPVDTHEESSTGGRLPMPKPIDRQTPGVPMSPLAPTAIPSIMCRTDIDPNFEPVTRGRSNTWPLVPEGFMESDEPSGGDPSTSGEAQRAQGVTSLFDNVGAGHPKKNTSRRNPWGNMSYADLIAKAIVSSSEARATLSQIYDWLVQNIPYFNDKGESNSSAGWKNSIRHNLSLHNRFMRMQNEGTGKSSWWVLNPDAKPGKSTRRRANTIEGSRMEKKRGRVRKKVDGVRSSIEAPSSPSIVERLDYYPGSPTTGPLHHPFQLSPQDYRPRASSNASSCGRLSPIPAIESDMHDAQVPPMSPGVVGWGPDYWSANNHAHSSHQPHLGHHVHEPYTDHLVESIGEGLKIGGPGSQEPWGPHHGLGPHSGSSDCLKLPHHHPHHHPHMNGFIPQSHNQLPPGFGSYDDYSSYATQNSQCGTFTPTQNKDKRSIRKPHLLSFQIPHHLQPLPSSHSPQDVSPTSGIGESHFSSCELDMRPTPSFSSPPPRKDGSPTNHHTPPSSQHHRTPSSSQQDPAETSKTEASPSFSSHRHPPRLAPESTTMLRVALSHREASSCNINGLPHYKQNGVGQHPGHSISSASDLVDLDTIQGGLECNVEEVIKHELQYEDHLNFDFQHAQTSYSHPHMYPHREGAGPQIGGSAGPVQVYSCSSIPSGNHWVR